MSLELLTKARARRRGSTRFMVHRRKDNPIDSEPERPRSGSVGRRVAFRVAGNALFWGVLAGTLTIFVLYLLGIYEVEVIPAVVLASLSAAFASFFVVQEVFARRLGRVASFVENRLKSDDSPVPLESMGDDELGQVAEAINRLLLNLAPRHANGDSAPGRLSPPAYEDRSTSDEQSSSQEKRLADDLARMTGELEQRLLERAVLFDVLRESAANQNLDAVLSTLVDRLGPAMHLREVAVLLRNPTGDYVVRAAWGFAEPASLIGRSIRPGEGIAGRAATRGVPVLVHDVATQDDYLAFWGEAERTGSFLSAPIRSRGSVIGLLTVTRSEDNPISETDSRYLSALADQVSLAIRNAQLFERLEELSTHDELTGLPNRRYLQQRLEHELLEAQRYGHPLTVLAIDIDHFKNLNDRWGHPHGDLALVTLANTFRESVRDVDTVARVGGEEFVVVLSRATLGDGQSVAEKLRVRVADLPFEGRETQPLGRLSISIGVATLEVGETIASLLARADRVLYSAKHAGRNQVMASSPPPPDPQPGWRL